MRAKSAMDIVMLCENQLGWTSPLMDKMSFPKARAIEARKLNAAMAKNPKATVAHLELAVELARRHNQTRTPLGLFYLLDEAISLANTKPEPAPTSLTAQINEAITTEQQQDRPDAKYWIGRLTRAQGTFRAQALTDWRAARTKED